MRPISHRGQTPEKRCENCKHGHVTECFGDLLCFHGDENTLIKPSRMRPEWSEIWFDGVDVELMEGEQYSKVWGGRAVCEADVCDEWERR